LAHIYQISDGVEHNPPPALTLLLLLLLLQLFFRASMFRHVARSYMALRECLVPNRRREAQEEVVADLHTCLEQLSLRTTELESRISHCAERAMYHFQMSKKEQTAMGKTRERQRAKMYMEDRRRVIAEHDKALRMTHALQAQIDSIVSSHVDMLILETMRGYNATAASLAMPQRASEIERLGEELADRHSEVNALQDAISGVTIACGSSTADISGSQDDDLMQELEALLVVGSSTPAPAAAPAAASSARNKMDDGAIITILSNDDTNDNETDELIPKPDAASAFVAYSPRRQQVQMLLS